MPARNPSKKSSTKIQEHQSFGAPTLVILLLLVVLALAAMWYISTNAGTTQSFLNYPGR